MRVQNIIKLAIVPILLSSVSLKADMETSIQFDTPLLNAGVEIGELTDSNHYFTASFHYGLENLNRVELGWSKVTSENESHLFGLGIGSLDGGNDKLGSFNVEDAVIYGTLDYRFYAKGIRDKGFHSYVKIAFDEDYALPFFGIGYNW